jgi:hypothetical protein
MIAQLAKANGALQTAVAIAQAFATIVRARQPDRLEAWLTEATSSGIKPSTVLRMACWPIARRCASY